MPKVRLEIWEKLPIELKPGGYGSQGQIIDLKPSSVKVNIIALFNNMRTVQFTAYHAKFVLSCRQSCREPLRKQVRYFREVNRSGS